MVELQVLGIQAKVQLDSYKCAPKDLYLWTQGHLSCLEVGVTLRVHEELPTGLPEWGRSIDWFISIPHSPLHHISTQNQALLSQRRRTLQRGLCRGTSVVPASLRPQTCASLVLSRSALSPLPASLLLFCFVCLRKGFSMSSQLA